MPKIWLNLKSHSKGGYFRCAIKRKEQSVRYGRSEKGRAAKQRYQKTDKGKQSLRKYQNSDKGLAVKQKHEKTRLRIQAGYVKLSYRIDPVEKHDIMMKIDKFKAQQKKEREETLNGRIN